ncbi:hypothetical protein [Staphylococcus phage S6]|nr:hypothetical protein [Staphylococcus phage S6]
MQTIFNSPEEVDFKKLAELARNNDNVLNTKAVHEGEYNYNFSIEGWNYSFSSDGTYWKWNYQQVNQ